MSGKNSLASSAGDEIFRALLESAPDAMVVTTADLKISLINSQTESLFGFRRDELVGASVESLMAERSRETARRFWSGFENEQTGGPTGPWLGLHGLKSDGSEFPAELGLSSVRSGDGHQVIASIRDVSERVRTQKAKEQLEARLRQAQRLESLGRLAGGIAHDFNNLLTVITHYTDLVTERLGDAALADEMSKIRKAADKGAALTRQLLIFSRRDVVRPLVLNLNEVVDNLAELLRRTLGEHIDLVTTTSKKSLFVRADPNQLEQLLINLAVNARDAMADGGTLTIACSRAVVDPPRSQTDVQKDSKAFVVIEVQDTGAGMDEETLSLAVDPFFTTKPAGTASGMGLPTAYGIITQSDGFMEIESQQGTGTTVRLFLPIVEADPES